MRLTVKQKSPARKPEYGEVRWDVEVAPYKQAYSVKNVGKTTMVTYTVNIKGGK